MAPSVSRFQAKTRFFAFRSDDVLQLKASINLLRPYLNPSLKCLVLGGEDFPGLEGCLIGVPPCILSNADVHGDAIFRFSER